MFSISMALIEDIATLKTIYWVAISLSSVYTFWFMKQYFSTFGYKSQTVIVRSISYTILELLLPGIIGGIIGVVYGIVLGMNA